MFPKLRRLVRISVLEEIGVADAVITSRLYYRIEITCYKLENLLCTL